MKDVPGFIWVQGRSERWFLMAIDDIRAIWAGDTDGTSEIYYRGSSEDHFSVVLHTPQDIGEMIIESRRAEIEMRQRARDEYGRLQ